MVALQCRRLRSSEPEDVTFTFRYWADLQFLIVSLQRLRHAAVLAAEPSGRRSTVDAAVQAFDDAVPDLTKTRNVGEHIDEYVLGQGHQTDVSRGQLQVGTWDGTTFEWLGVGLNIEVALAAAEQLFEAIRDPVGGSAKR